MINLGMGIELHTFFIRKDKQGNNKHRSGVQII